MSTDISILLVDDDSTVREAVKEMLDGLGFKNIAEAEDGEAALAALRDGEFGLLVTDWNVPKLSGVELVRSIRADDALKGIPVIMVAAEATREQIIAAAEAGVDSYLIQPLTAETLEARITALLEQPTESAA